MTALRARTCEHSTTASSRRARHGSGREAHARRKAIRIPGAGESSLVLEYALDESVNVCDAERLTQHCGTSPFEKARVFRRLRGPTHEGEPRQQVRVLLFKFAIQAHAVELRHPEVTQDDVVGAGGDLLHALTAILGRIDLVSLQPQDVCHERRHQRLVINHENVSSAGFGGGHWLGEHSQVASGEGQQAPGHCETIERSAAYRDLPSVLFPKMVTHGPLTGTRWAVFALGPGTEGRVSVPDLDIHRLRGPAIAEIDSATE